MAFLIISVGNCPTKNLASPLLILPLSLWAMSEFWKFSCCTKSLTKAIREWFVKNYKNNEQISAVLCVIGTYKTAPRLSYSFLIVLGVTVFKEWVSSLISVKTKQEQGCCSFSYFSWLHLVSIEICNNLQSSKIQPENIEMLTFCYW